MIKWYNVKKSMMIRKLWVMFWYYNKIESWRWKKQKFQKWYILRNQNVIQTLRRMNVDVRISIFEIIRFSMFECWHDMTENDKKNKRLTNVFAMFLTRMLYLSTCRKFNVIITINTNITNSIILIKNNLLMLF